MVLNKETNFKENIIDFYINIVKSIIRRMDEFSNFNKIRKLIIQIFELDSKSESIVNTTKKNIILTLLWVQNNDC